MDSRILQIIIKARDEATATLESMSGTGSGFDKVTRAAGMAGAALTAFGVATVAALASTLDPYREAAKAELMLENTIENMPKLAGANIQSFKDLASSLQATTAAEDDAVIQGMALLGTFNQTEDQVLGIMPLIVDYARKFGVDIPDAAKQVGKALDGNMASLKKNGVSIDEVMFKTDAYGAVQKALREQVGGFAAKEAESGIAAGERLANAFGNLKEMVGEVVAKAINPFIGRFTAFIDRIQKSNPHLVELVTKGAMIAVVFSLIAGPILMLIGFLPMLSSGWALVSGAMLPAAAIIAALAAAAYLVYSNWAPIKQELQPVIDLIRNDVLPALSDFAADMKDKAVEAMKTFRDWARVNLLPMLVEISDKFKLTVPDAIKKAKEAFAGLKQLANDIYVILKPVIDWIKTNIGPVLLGVADIVKTSLVSALDNLKQAWANIKPQVEPLLPLLKYVGAFLIAVVVTPMLISIGVVLAFIIVLAKIVEAVSWVVAQASFFFTGLWEIIREWAATVDSNIRGFCAGLIEIFTGLVASVSGFFSNLVTNAVDAGTNMVRGIWDGISSMASWLEDRISSWVGDIIAFAKRILHIASPSGVFAEIGGQIAAGLGVGIMDGLPMVTNALQPIVNYSPAAASPMLQGAGSAGTPEITVISRLYLDERIISESVDKGLAGVGATV